MPPGATASCVIPATPSSALGTLIPCQWMEVAAGRWLTRVTLTQSPCVTRSSGPGTVPLKAQAWRPPIVVTEAVRVKSLTRSVRGGGATRFTTEVEVGPGKNGAALYATGNGL